MTLKIIRDSTYSSPMLAKDIHGKYPYKLYLEIRGNTYIGRYIVVVSNRQLNKDVIIDEIVVQLKETEQNNNKRRLLSKKPNDNGIIRPNMLNGSFINTYKVSEKSIIDVCNVPLTVYKPV